MARLFVTYCLAIPLMMAFFVVVTYMTNVSVLVALVQRPWRGYFANYVVTRIIIEFFFLLVLACVVAVSLFAPRLFPEFFNTLPSPSAPVRWFLYAVSMGVPGLVLLALRAGFVQGWRSNASKHR